MSAGHTPGPWTLVALDAPKSLHMISAKVGEKNPLICSAEHSRSGSIDHAQAGHNARLIAAAPDLLEALRDMLDGWKYIRQSHGDLYGVGWDRAQDKAETAIAKAAGKTL